MKRAKVHDEVSASREVARLFLEAVDLMVEFPDMEVDERAWKKLLTHLPRPKHDYINSVQVT